MTNNYYKVTRWLAVADSETKRADSRYFPFDGRNPEDEIRAADAAYKVAHHWGVTPSCYARTDRGFPVIGETPRALRQLGVS